MAIRYLIWEKWIEDGVRKEHRLNLEHGTEAASLQDAIEQFDKSLEGLSRPAGFTRLERDSKVLGDVLKYEDEPGITMNPPNDAP